MASYLSHLPSKMRALKMRGRASKFMRRRGGLQQLFFGLAVGFFLAPLRAFCLKWLSFGDVFAVFSLDSAF